MPRNRVTEQEEVCIWNRVGWGIQKTIKTKTKTRVGQCKSITTPTEQRTNLEVREVCSLGQLEQHSNEVNLVQGSLPFFYTINLAHLGNQAGGSTEEQLRDPLSLKMVLLLSTQIHN